MDVIVSSCFLCGAKLDNPITVSSKDVAACDSCDSELTEPKPVYFCSNCNRPAPLEVWDIDGDPVQNCPNCGAFDWQEENIPEYIITLSDDTLAAANRKYEAQLRGIINYVQVILNEIEADEK